MRQVAASRFFSIMLAEDGRVWACGAGFNGELGTGTSWATSPQLIGPLQQVAWCQNAWQQEVGEGGAAEAGLRSRL